LVQEEELGTAKLIRVWRFHYLGGIKPRRVIAAYCSNNRKGQLRNTTNDDIMQKTSKRTTSKLNVAAARNNVGSRIIDSDSDSDCDWLPPEEETAALAGIDPGPDEDCPWQSAEDPATGKTYYYHIHTRETQWSKPAEMGSREERAALAAKEKRQKDFFAAMEANILSTISQGLKAPEKQNKLDDEFAGNEISDGPLDFSLSSRTASTKRLTPRRNSHSSHGRPDLVRTISTMDTSLLRDLISRAPSSRTIARGSSHSNTSSNVGGARKQGNVSLPRGSSHSHLSSRKNRIMRGVGDRQGSKIIRKQAHDDDSDEPPPLTVVTTPDLRKRESIQKNASSRSVKPNPRDNLARDDSMTLGQLQQVTGGSDGNASLGGALGGGVGGGSISIGNFGSHITFDNSFSLEESGGSLGGFGSSHHSMDSSTRYSDSHLSINSNLLTVEEGHEFEGTPPFKVVTAHDVVLEDEEEDDESPHGGSFSLGSGHGDSFHDKGAANWLDGLPTDDAGQGEDMVGYGSTAKPFKDAGYTSFFDESMANFDLSDKETQQLQKLAYISEQMTHVMEGEEESDEETSSSCFSSESDGSQESGDFDIPGLIPNDEEPLEFSLPGLGKQPAEYHLNFSDEAIDAQAQDKAPPPPCFSTPRTGGTESIPSTEVTRSPVKRKPVPKRTLGSRAAGVPRQLKSVESLTDGEHNKSDDDERSKQPTAPQLLGGMALTIDNAGGHFGESSGPLTLTVDNAAGRPSRQTLGGHSGPGTMSNNSMSSAKSNRSTMSGRSGRSLSSKGMTSAAHRLSMFRLKDVDLSKLRHVDGVQSNTGASKVGTPQKRGSRPELVRRNTCGTLHVGTTMSTPDKDATIKVSASCLF